MITKIYILLEIFFTVIAGTPFEKLQVHNALPNFYGQNNSKLNDDIKNYSTWSKPQNFMIEQNDGTKIEFCLEHLEHNVISGSIPVYTVKTDKTKFFHQDFEKVQEETMKNFDTTYYQDYEKLAIIHYNNNEYNGVFGVGKPKKIKNAQGKKIEEPCRRVNPNEKILSFDYNETIIEYYRKKYSNQSKDELSQETLSTIYPKFLVIVDYNLFKVLGEDITETVEYVTTFWNAVNLRYSQYKLPKVKISVTGIIIAKDKTAMSYISDARRETDPKFFDDESFYFDIVYYLHEDLEFRKIPINYDAIFFMVNLEFLDRGQTAGSTSLGKICSHAVGFSFDFSQFEGMDTVTHETGHMFNMEHDSDKTEINCMPNADEKTSYMMSGGVNILPKTRWSQCNQLEIQNFAQLKKAECLKFPYSNTVPSKKFQTSKNTESIKKKVDSKMMVIKIDDRTIRLNATLSQNIGDEPIVWWANSLPGLPLNFSLIEAKELNAKNLSFYENIEKMAFLYLKDHLLLNGTIGKRKPKVLRPQKLTIISSQMIDYEEQNVIFDYQKNYSIIQSFLSKYPNVEMTGKPLQKLELTFTVAVEYNLFKSLGSDIDEVIKFVLIFWKSVNLRFRKFTFPKVAIEIENIVVLKDDAALKHLRESYSNSTDSNKMKSIMKIWSENLNNSTIKFVDENLSSPNLVIMLNRENGTGRNSDKNSTILSSWPKSICPTEHFTTSYFETDTEYFGIDLVVDELARLFNIRRDEDYETDADCRLTVANKYLPTKRKYLWSECSQKDLLYFSLMKAARCLR